MRTLLSFLVGWNTVVAIAYGFEEHSFIHVVGGALLLVIYIAVMVTESRTESNE